MESDLLVMNGDIAGIYSGYKCVGTLYHWTLSASNRMDWSVSAVRVHLEEYWIEHGPKPLVIRMAIGARGYWRAPVEMIGPMTFRGLAPMEVVNDGEQESFRQTQYR